MVEAAPTPNADDTRPEEKALAEKLMQELKASGVDVDAMAQTAAAPTTSTPAANTTSTPPPTPPITSSPESKPSIPPAEPKLKKKIGLPKITLPKMPSPKKTEPVIATVPEIPASVGNETQQLTNEVLVKMIDEKLAKMSSDDFIVFKISKQGLLVLVGLLLIIIWVVPLFKFGMGKVTNGIHIQLPQLTQKKPLATENPVPSATPVPTPVTQSMIRVRMGSNSLQAANEIESILSKAGFTKIDLLYDEQVNAKNFMIVTRTENVILKDQLTTLFADKYHVSSESATLSDDSDFAASILVGKNSKK